MYLFSLNLIQGNKYLSQFHLMVSWDLYKENWDEKYWVCKKSIR